MADYRNFESMKRKDAAPPRSSASPTPSFCASAYAAYDDLDQTVLKTLHDAALDAAPDAAKKALYQVLDQGQTHEQVFDNYIPAVARTLGDMWCSDELSFAGVTIGVARLQSMLRELGPNWSGEHAATTGASSILLVVPQEVYHTLGAFVLSGQLRRMGLSVKLVVGGTPKDIAEYVSRTNYDAVFISSSRGETLESLRLIVDAVQHATSVTLPIVIGGTILEVETPETVTALTGANHATKIPQEALDYCGLHLISRVIAFNEPGT